MEKNISVEIKGNISDVIKEMEDKLIIFRIIDRVDSFLQKSSFSYRILLKLNKNELNLLKKYFKVKDVSFEYNNEDSLKSYKRGFKSYQFNKK